jgi:hypothetical protein
MVAVRNLRFVPLFGKKDDRPILAVDIDGVISLFGFPEPVNAAGMKGPDAPGEFHLIDGMLHCLALRTGPMLNRLGEHYELIWASGWEDRANDHLPRMLGVPKLHHLTFDGRAQFGTAHWKLDALDEYAGGRALAWIDDSLDRSCYEWADSRSAPTLLVPTESSIGLTEAHVATLESWALELSAAA